MFKERYKDPLQRPEEQVHAMNTSADALLIGNDTYFIAFIRFMGEDTEAKKFRYSLEMGVDGRELKGQGVPRSIRDTHQKHRKSVTV
ncbi:hypothetical protein CTI12_AA053000 [Artemisia annua]|uniref:Seven-in-absentia protein TRAF-like domain-containing protein n=1 Tax=Artemisia annua TaxID=35608 RepID=A0A2U1QAT1_ARTAN|nr:hypothetical protein CTI12_AA053000 [Artemisia annua]